MVSPQIIRNIIDQYNFEEPKNPSANVEDLILVDNSATLTIKNHLGNLLTVIVSGRWGSGKTYSALKLFHDLKSSLYITYVPVRYASTINPSTKIRGKVSTLATIIAKSFAEPRSMSKEYGVITNAPDKTVEININKELEDFLEDYYHIIKNENTKHILLLDELELSIKGPEDLDTLIDSMKILRKLYDKYGSNRLMIIYFTSPFQPGTAPYNLTGVDEISLYIRSKLHELGSESRYIYDKIIFLSLDDIQVVKDTLLGILHKSRELIKKKLNLDVNLRNEKATIELIAKNFRWIRFGRDILIIALSRAYSGEKGGTDIDLKELLKEAIRESLGFPMLEKRVGRAIDPEKLLLENKLAEIPINFDHVSRIIESKIFNKIGRSDINFFKMEDRTELGFQSITYISRISVQARGRPSISYIPITFWFRFSDINPKTISKANRIFAGRRIILIMTEDSRIKADISGIDLSGVIHMPSEIIYYLIAGDIIRDTRIREELDERFEREYAHKIISSIRQIFGM